MGPSRRPLGAVAVLALPLLAACQGEQSVLTPRSGEAEAIADMAWLLFWGAGAILAFVVAALAWALAARPGRAGRARPSPATGRAWVLGAGLAFPVVTLCALLVHELGVSARLRAPPAGDPVRVEVTGRMWWWQVRYPDLGFETANEIRLPVGRPAEILVRADDVIHSFWVPNLMGKIDMIPGRTNRVAFTPAEPGVMRGQCAEFCGLQHARMAFHVVAEEPEAFEAWARRQAAPAAPPPPGEPGSEADAAGRRAFAEWGCGACHALRGLPGAEGAIGPDLTRVGSRVALAAGTLDNGVGAMAGWIASADHLKPGNGMPSYDRMDGPTLRALAAWLEGLR
jgi:cytochrome c oxidase subunit 2